MRQDNKTLTLEEAAKELGVHLQTAYRYAQQGMIPFYKIGGRWRISRGKLDQFLETGMWR